MANSFKAIETEFSAKSGVETGRMFGSEGLKIGGKVFAMLVKDSLVVKVPVSRANELLSSKLVKLFDPGHGRLMKEWIVLEKDSKINWVSIAKESFAFVQANNKHGAKARKRE